MPERSVSSLTPRRFSAAAGFNFVEGGGVGFSPSLKAVLEVDHGLWWMQSEGDEVRRGSLPPEAFPKAVPVDASGSAPSLRQEPVNGRHSHFADLGR